ncbi:MAG: pilus assembly protein TadG-related protein [Planctomycetota bacterium]
MADTTDILADKRKGQILVIAAVALVVLGLTSALMVDLGFWFKTEADLQNAADAAGRAAIFELMDQRSAGKSEAEARTAAAQEARDIASINHPPARTEVEFGTYAGEPKQFTTVDPPTTATAVSTHVARDSQTGSTPLTPFFASLAGLHRIEAAGNTVCQGANDIIGMRSGSGLRPFGIPEEDVKDWSYGDSITVPVPDQPAHPNSAPGNWGWLDIDGGSKGVPEMKEWIEDGYDEEIVLNTSDEDGTTCTFMEGSPGLRSTLKNSIDQIVGEDVVCFIYDDVSGQGANTKYRIVGFVAMRITDVQWGQGNKESHLKARFLDMSSESSALLGSGGSEHSNLMRVQLVK